MLKADDLKKLNFSRRYQRRLLAFIFLLFFLFPNGIMAMQIDLKNGSGEDKKEWPVILKAYHVFGKNLSPGSLDLSKLLIKDSSGQSLPYDLVHLPPYDQPGNDLIVFLISLKKDQTLTVMITQTQKKGLHKKIDLVQSPHNLIPGAGFDTAEDLSKHWQGQGKLDSSVKHDGAASLLLNTKHRAKMMLKKKMVLHVGSPYIFGGWG
ncbi:MAG: hypothetical protein HRT89_05740, partial [Lentisphaeria bacterium]|nr:hypothetical protein [Lentisphaeria bacterium]